MSSVLNLSDYRKPAKPKPHDLTGERFFCVSCDSDEFKIMADGKIHCSHCTSRINNLNARKW